VYGLFIATSLSAEGHLGTINHKQKVEGVDKGTLTDIIGAHDLERIAVIEGYFGFAEDFGVQKGDFSKHNSV
jgi:hypothetical protein